MEYKVSEASDIFEPFDPNGDLPVCDTCLSPENCNNCIQYKSKSKEETNQ
jgi:hypothetical protein